MDVGHNRQQALQQLSELRPAPSVQMQDVPRESLSEHLGLGGVHAHAPIDELDERLARTFAIIFRRAQDQTLTYISLANRTRAVRV